MSISNRKTVLLTAVAAGALALGATAAGAQMSGGSYASGAGLSSGAMGAGMPAASYPSRSMDDRSMSGSSMSGTTSGAAYGGGMMMDRGARTGGAVIGPGGMAADSGAFDDWNNRIEPAWDQYRGQIQRQFSRIPPARLGATNGARSDVLALIQEHYNLSNERAHERLWQWQRGGDMRAYRSR